MKTHYDPYPHAEESEEQAICGTLLGEESSLSGEWSRVDCCHCLKRKEKITSSIAADEAEIVRQMGDMANYMRKVNHEQEI